MSTSRSLYFTSQTARGTHIGLFKASFEALATCNIALSFGFFWKRHMQSDFHLTAPHVETRGAITTKDPSELSWKREEGSHRDTAHRACRAVCLLLILGKQ